MLQNAPSNRITPAIRLVASLAFMVSLSACTSAPNPDAASTRPLVQIDDAITGVFQQMPVARDVNGTLAVLYQTQDGRVTYKHGDQSIKLDEQTAIKGGKWLQINHNQNTVYASWWSPQNKKSLYLTTSKDNGQTFSPAVRVNEDENALPPYALMTDALGNVSMTYMDERLPQFNVYVNHSTNFGLSWNTPDQRLDAPLTPSTAMYPQAFKTDGAWVIAWTDTVESMGRSVYRILARRSIDQGKTWGDANVIVTESSMISGLTSDQQGNNFVLMMDVSGKGIQAMTSTDSGSTWHHAKELAGTQSVTNSFIRLAIAENNAYAVWIEQTTSIKPRIMRGKLDITSGSWVGSASRMDIKPFENTKSSMTDIIATPSGELVAGWMDFRDIRPNIYLSASFDKGATWTTPQPMAKPGMASLGFFEFIPWKNGIAINYQSFPTDNAQNGSVIVEEIHLAAPKGLALQDFSTTSFDDKQRGEMLKQRVNAFWQHRIKGQHAEGYAFFDPAYKKSFNLETFTGTQGMLTYQAAKLLDYSIEGNEAIVNLKITYEAKEAMFSGKPVSIPSSEVDVTNTWVWIGDNWYMVFKPTTGEPMLVY